MDMTAASVATTELAEANAIVGAENSVVGLGGHGERGGGQEGASIEV